MDDESALEERRATLEEEIRQAEEQIELMELSLRPPPEYPWVPRDLEPVDPADLEPWWSMLLFGGRGNRVSRAFSVGAMMGALGCLLLVGVLHLIGVR